MMNPSVSPSLYWWRGMLVIFTLSFCFTAPKFFEISAQEAKKDEPAPVELTIFEYNGLTSLSASYGVLNFDVLVNSKDGALNKKKLYLWPVDLRMEVRKDKQLITTLRVAAKHRESAPAEEMIESATLLVPNSEDQTKWRDHLDDLRISNCTIAGLIERVTLHLTDGRFFMHIKTDVAYQPPGGAQKSKIDEVRVALDGVEIVSNHSALPDIGPGAAPLFIVEWPRVTKGEKSDAMKVTADKLKIVAKDPSKHEAWQEILRGFREKTGPHRVLPPNNP